MAIHKSIYIQGARVHNLRNIDLTIPHNRLVVITGLSGSGKSTLAFDTIFAEGQRRYVESLSAYARQFLGKIAKPDVDIISGIAPAIAIEQKVNTRNPRSTVGTSTEIYDYLQLLFARAGHTFSPVSGCEVHCDSIDDVAAWVLTKPDERVVLTVPIRLHENEGLIEHLLGLLQEGLMRVRVAGEVRLIEDFLATMSEMITPDQVEVVIDRLRVASDEDSQTRLRDSIGRAYSYGHGVCRVVAQSEERLFSSRFEADGIAFEQPTEHLFSFNNPIGACPRCEGYGKVMGIDEDLVIPDKSRSVYDDAVACWRGETMRRWRDALVRNAHHFGFPIHTPYHDLTADEKLLLWRGNEWFDGLDAFFDYIDKERYKIQFRVMKARYTGKTRCPDCGGSRLRKEALYVKVGDKNIAELVAMPVDELIAFFDALQLDEHDSKVAQRILIEIRNRLGYLSEVGLGYLTLDRLSSTLSGGESQRINLATSLGSNLTGSLYILDEPSIGLHPRDTHRLIRVLKQLRDLGNTVIVVEHEEEVIRAADYLIDMGPEAGQLGGEVVYSGPADEIDKAERSLTADYLTGRRSIPTPKQVRAWDRSISIKGARENNLKGIDVEIPLGVMTCITGVSGSGKSSLAKGIIYPALKRLVAESGDKPGDYEGLGGDLSLLTGVEMVDQNPIGKSSRSNPVTYLKAYDEIRHLFAEQPRAKHTGLSASAFSFNVAGGRCEECQGEGVIKVSMQFMADVELVCEACKGRRFRDEILEVTYRDRSICDVLEMNIDEAIDFFGADPSAICKRIVSRLKPLQDVGLGYVKLGQSSSTLSGGESQRIKLASFLTRDESRGSILFIFDEPTTGLHFHDIKRLLKALQALIDQGHTVLIVEHNMEIIKSADWVIDLGPEAGDAGGRVVFAGTPKELTEVPESHTGAFLKPHYTVE